MGKTLRGSASIVPVQSNEYTRPHFPYLLIVFLKIFPHTFARKKRWIYLQYEEAITKFRLAYKRESFLSLTKIYVLKCFYFISAPRNCRLIIQGFRENSRLVTDTKFKATVLSYKVKDCRRDLLIIQTDLLNTDITFFAIPTKMWVFSTFIY